MSWLAPLALGSFRSLGIAATLNNDFGRPERRSSSDQNVVLVDPERRSGRPERRSGRPEGHSGRPERRPGRPERRSARL